MRGKEHWALMEVFRSIHLFAVQLCMVNPFLLPCIFGMGSELVCKREGRRKREASYDQFTGTFGKVASKYIATFYEFFVFVFYILFLLCVGFLIICIESCLELMNKQYKLYMLPVQNI